MGVVYRRVPFVRHDRCVGCGICEAICPHNCLQIEDEISVLVRPHDCTSDAACVFACPHNALRMAPAVISAPARRRVAGLKI